MGLCYVKPGFRGAWIMFCNMLVVAQGLLILLAFHRDLTQVEFNVSLSGWFGDHGFGLE